MARTKARKVETKRYEVGAERRGVMKFGTAYNAPEAARLATQYARQGYTAEVHTFSGRGFAVGRKTVHMTCAPQVKGTKTVAACVLKPAFKKRVKGL